MYVLLIASIGTRGSSDSKHLTPVTRVTEQDNTVVIAWSNVRHCHLLRTGQHREVRCQGLVKEGVISLAKINVTLRVTDLRWGVRGVPGDIVGLSDCPDGGIIWADDGWHIYVSLSRNAGRQGKSE